MAEFTHFNSQGDAVMVDVSEKAETKREAIATGKIMMSKECFEKIQHFLHKKKSKTLMTVC